VSSASSTASFDFGIGGKLGKGVFVPEANNCKGQSDFEFFLNHYVHHSNEKGNLYTWGSGEMGQLGYDSTVISQMPKDRDGYPFQVSYKFNSNLLPPF
jgi:alpha-tubulin suppressor-like RCC1 family protein